MVVGPVGVGDKIKVSRTVIVGETAFAAMSEELPALVQPPVGVIMTSELCASAPFCCRSLAAAS